MQFLQLGLIFIILISVVVIIFKFIAFLIPIFIWLIGFIFIVGIITIFAMLFYNMIKK